MPLVLVVAVPLTTGAIVAAAAGPTDPSGGLLNYGLAGLLGLILVTFFYRVLTREQQLRDAADAEVKRLNGIIQQEVVPTVRSAIEAIRENTEVLMAPHDEVRPRPVRRRAT